jgi:uncharacterized protein involved in exopolysaccharide biosynthesis
MDLHSLGSRVARRWWLVAGLALIAAIGAAVAVSGGSEERQTRVEFVLRPDASVTNDDLPGTLEALKSDGTLVRTVVGVLGNRTMLRRAADDVDVTLTPEYKLDADAQPGSTLIDATLRGPDAETVERLVTGYDRAASLFVASSYPAYVLDRLSTAAVTGDGPSTSQIVVLALLLGAALGVALVAAEARLEPQRQRRASAGPPAPKAQVHANGGAPRPARRRARVRDGDPEGEA